MSQAREGITTRYLLLLLICPRGQTASDFFYLYLPNMIGLRLRAIPRDKS